MKHKFLTLFITIIALINPAISFSQPTSDNWVSLGDYLKGKYQYDAASQKYTLPSNNIDYPAIEKIAYKKINKKNQDKSILKIGCTPRLYLKSSSLLNKFNIIDVYSDFTIKVYNKKVNSKEFTKSDDGWVYYNTLSTPAFIIEIDNLKLGENSNIFENIYVVPGKTNFQTYLENWEAEKRAIEAREGKWISLKEASNGKEKNSFLIFDVNSHSIKKVFPFELQGVIFSSIGYPGRSINNSVQLSLEKIADVKSNGSFESGGSLNPWNLKDMNTHIEDNMLVVDLDAPYVLTGMLSPEYEEGEGIYVRLAPRFEPEAIMEANKQKEFEYAKTQLSAQFEDYKNLSSPIKEINPGIITYENGDFIKFHSTQNPYSSSNVKVIIDQCELTLRDGTKVSMENKNKNIYTITEPSGAKYVGTLLPNSDSVTEGIDNYLAKKKNSFNEGVYYPKSGAELYYPGGLTKKQLEAKKKKEEEKKQKEYNDKLLKRIDEVQGYFKKRKNKPLIHVR